jgi:hypothetical protein
MKLPLTAFIGLLVNKYVIKPAPIPDGMPYI